MCIDMCTKQQIRSVKTFALHEKEKAHQKGSGDRKEVTTICNNDCIQSCSKKICTSQNFSLGDVNQENAVEQTKRDFTSKKTFISRIPVRIKSGPNTSPSQTTSAKLHLPSLAPPHLIAVNKSSFKMESRTKEYLQLTYVNLLQKQMPLTEMLTFLAQTKKQLANLNVKLFHLKCSETSKDYVEYNFVIEFNLLNNFVSNVIHTCDILCKKCILTRLPISVFEDLVKSTQNFSKTDIDSIKSSSNAHLIQEAIQNNESISKLIARQHRRHKLLSISKKATLKTKQKTIKCVSKNVLSNADHITTKKNDEKLAHQEKIITELKEKIKRLEKNLEAERKSSEKSLTKGIKLSRRVNNIQLKAKESEAEILNKFKRLQSEMRIKKLEWYEEKQVFIKNEKVLREKLTELQGHFNDRVKSMEEEKININTEHEKHCKNFEIILKTKEEEISMLQHGKNSLQDEYDMLNCKLHEMKDENKKQILKLHNEKMLLEEEHINLQTEYSTLKIQLNEKNNEMLELRKSKKSEYVKLETELTQVRQQLKEKSEEIKIYQEKFTKAQSTLDNQTEHLAKLQSSVTAHAELAIDLKFEKDDALDEVENHRIMLLEARDTIVQQTKLIDKLHEKLSHRENDCQKLKYALKKYKLQSFSTTMKYSYGKIDPQPLSDSFIGIFTEKVDSIQHRLNENIRAIQMPRVTAKKRFNTSSPGERHWCRNKRPSGKLGRHLGFKKQLHQLFRSYANKSGDELFNCLKFVASSGDKWIQDDFVDSDTSEHQESTTSFKYETRFNRTGRLSNSDSDEEYISQDYDD